MPARAPAWNDKHELETYLEKHDGERDKHTNRARAKGPSTLEGCGDACILLGNGFTCCLSQDLPRTQGYGCQWYQTTGCSGSEYE